VAVNGLAVPVAAALIGIRPSGRRYMSTRRSSGASMTADTSAMPAAGQKLRPPPSAERIVAEKEQKPNCSGMRCCLMRATRSRRRPAETRQFAAGASAQDSDSRRIGFGRPGVAMRSLRHGVRDVGPQRREASACFRL
jgi:hypothetical protein